MKYSVNLFNSFNTVGQWLYQWQTLVGAVLALVAAWATVRVLRTQINQTELYQRDQATRRHNAARVALPLALSSVGKIIQKIADDVATELEKYGPNGFERTFEAIIDGDADKERFDNVSLSENVTASLQQFVQSLDNQGDVRHVGELIGTLQIMLARYNEMDLQSAAVVSQLYDLQICCAKAKLLNERMFNYARFVDGKNFAVVGVLSNDDAWDEIYKEAERLVFLRPSSDFFFPELRKRVASAKQSAKTPWIEKMGHD